MLLEQAKGLFVSQNFALHSIGKGKGHDQVVYGGGGGQS